jgi:hypothetical protein
MMGKLVVRSQQAWQVVLGAKEAEAEVKRVEGNRKRFENLLSGLLSLLCSIVSAWGSRIPALLAGDVPGFLPALIADAVAEGEHRLHVCALPPYPAAFQTCFHHPCVGTLHHT